MNRPAILIKFNGLSKKQLQFIVSEMEKRVGQTYSYEMIEYTHTTSVISEIQAGMFLIGEVANHGCDNLFSAEVI